MNSPAASLRSLLLFLSIVFSISALAQGTPTSTPPSTPQPQSVRISFLPPPLEGTISLGIYDAKGTLVRVLHREAELDDFDVGADALHTKWDGKNDAGEDMPRGKYSAGGFVVGDLDVEEVADPVSSTVPALPKVKVKLVENPLTPGDRPSIELIADFDEDASYLKTVDGLPLYTVDELPGIARVSLGQQGEKSVEVFEDDGDSVAQLHVSGVDKIMAFDCGGFELK